MAKAPNLGERKCPNCKEIIKADAAICKHCQSSFSQDEIALAMAADAKRKRWTLVGCLSPLVLIGSCVAIVTATSETPSTVKAADPSIAEVHSFKDAKHAEVKTDLNTSWSASDLPIQAAMVLESAGKAIKAGATDVPAGIETVTFWFTAPLTDAHGNESRSKVLQFTVKTADLRAIQYDNMTSRGVLEFAYDVGFGGPAGRRATEEYCSENANISPRFCANVG